MPQSTNTGGGHFYTVLWFTDFFKDLSWLQGDTAEIDT